MKILLDIKDDKAAFIMELLQNFKFVKTRVIPPEKAQVLEGLLEAAEEVNQVKSGKKKSQPLNEFLNQL